MEDLNTTQVKAILPLTVFILGYGIGPMFLSPLSEHPPIGRTYIYVVTLFIFVIVQIPTALADTIEKIVGLRLIAGFMASPALSTGGATIGDMVHPNNLYKGLIVWALFAFSGPTFGPLIGQSSTSLWAGAGLFGSCAFYLVLSWLFLLYSFLKPIMTLFFIDAL